MNIHKQYRFGPDKYCNERRWTLYYKQLELATKCKYKNYLVIGPGDHIVPLLIKHVFQDSIVDTFDIKDGSTYQGDLVNISNIVNKSYDCIICCEVLEHIEWKYFDSIIKDLKQLCNKKLIISVPQHKGNMCKYHQWEVGMHETFSVENIIFKLKTCGKVNHFTEIDNLFHFFDIDIGRKNILFFGPCFMRETIIYLPYLLNSLNINDLNIDVCYVSGLNCDFFDDFNKPVCDLWNSKYKYLNRNGDFDMTKGMKSHCQFWRYSNNSDKWCTDHEFHSKTFNDILDLGLYDIIIFSDNKGNRISSNDKMINFLESTNNFIAKIKTKFPKTKFIYFSSDCHYRHCREFVRTHSNLTKNNFEFETIQDIEHAYINAIAQIKTTNIDELIDGFSYYKNMYTEFNREDRFRHDCTHLYSGFPKGMVTLMIYHNFLESITDIDINKLDLCKYFDYINSNVGGKAPVIHENSWISTGYKIATKDYKWKKRE